MFNPDFGADLNRDRGQHKAVLQVWAILRGAKSEFDRMCSAIVRIRPVRAPRKFLAARAA